MSITPIITLDEANAYLADYPDWLALSDSVKTKHIYNASLYINTKWSCVDVDLDDTVLMPEEIKHASALYALADSVSNLYGSPAITDSRRTTRELVKAGSVTVEEEFAGSGSTVQGAALSFGLPDSLMSLYCVALRTTGLIRV